MQIQCTLERQTRELIPSPEANFSFASVVCYYQGLSTSKDKLIERIKKKKYKQIKKTSYLGNFSTNYVWSCGKGLTN